MTAQGVKRKLSAILSADVEGYSRLMAQDEVATVQTLTSYREAMTSLIEQHRGRVVDSPGDNLLAEFSSVVDAVQCAVAVQKEFQARNAELPEERRMEFRIGINLGDVIEEGGRIYGDGVNIAARLEALADPGGICVSKTAFDHIETKLPFGYEYLGDQTVKNIPKPVGAYRVVMEPRVTVAGAKDKKAPIPVWRRKGILVSAITVLILIIALAIWNFYVREPRIEPASTEKMVFPLPEKPSIAVLPFKNLSGEAGQEFLADGITESIIGAISRVSELFVIASNSVFTYKGKAVKVQTVSEELGVRNILEGTVQRSGNQLRINAQLIDATTGRHLWSAKYDREMKDLFAVQDDISKEILAALRVRLVEGEQERVWAKGTNNLEAYLKFLKAYDTFRSFSKENMILTRQICEEAIALDSNYEQPHSLIGVAHLIDVWFSWGESPRSSIHKSEAALKRAISQYPQSDFAYANLGHLYLVQERHDEAVAAGEKSVTLNPNGDYNMALLGITFNYVRRYEEAITLFKEARRRNPYCPAWYIHNMGNSYRGLGRWDEAIAEYKRALELKPDHFPALSTMASVYGMAGRIAEGRAVAAEMLRINPGFCTEKLKLPFKYKPDAEAVWDGLRKVGIPEKLPLPLPDKPSIAVLPFNNLSDDPKQEYFADGMTDDLITDLSKMSGVFVIARNSVFQYKGKAVDVKKISRELGVRYLLEGSVRRADDKVRINAQLIDATTGGHLWAERYDGKMGDVFGLQDKITEKIVASLAVELTSDEQENVARRATDNVEAYDAYFRGYAYRRLGGPENFKKFITYMKKAVELDPDYSDAHAALSYAYWSAAIKGWAKEWGYPDARSLAKKHMQLAMRNPTASVHRAAAWDYIWKHEHEKAIAEAERALTLEPSGADSHEYMGRALVFAGRSKEAVEFLKRAMRLDPSYPPATVWWLGLAQFCAGQYEEAVTSIERARKLNPTLAVWPQAAAYGHLGRKQEAADRIAEYLKARKWKKIPDLKRFSKWYPFKDSKDRNHFDEGLRKAGVSEE